MKRFGASATIHTSWNCARHSGEPRQPIDAQDERRSLETTDFLDNSINKLVGSTVRCGSGHVDRLLNDTRYKCLGHYEFLFSSRTETAVTAGRSLLFALNACISNDSARINRANPTRSREALE
jgi:hypothetical protein